MHTGFMNLFIYNCFTFYLQDKIENCRLYAFQLTDVRLTDMPKLRRFFLLRNPKKTSVVLFVPGNT